MDVMQQRGTLYIKMTKQLMIWAFVITFLVITSYVVVADDTIIQDLLGDKTEPIKDEVIQVKAEVLQEKPDILNNLDGYTRSEIDCTTGKFHAYKEGEIDRDLYVNCADAKNNEELKQLMNEAINKEVEEYKKVRGITANIIKDTRLEKVRLIR